MATDDLLYYVHLQVNFQRVVRTLSHDSRVNMGMTVVGSILNGIQRWNKNYIHAAGMKKI